MLQIERYLKIVKNLLMYLKNLELLNKNDVNLKSAQVIKHNKNVFIV